MPRDGSQTRERILDAAQSLVLERGFAATSVDEVIAGAASSKGAFFHHFATKNDLGRALVARYAAADVESLRSALAIAEERSDDPATQLLEFIRVFEEAAESLVDVQQSSCLYVSFIYDRELGSDGTTTVINEAVVAWRQAISEKLVAAGLTTVDPADLADHVFVTFEGAFILARTMGDTSLMRAQLRTLRGLLQSVLAATSHQQAANGQSQAARSAAPRS